MKFLLVVLPALLFACAKETADTATAPPETENDYHAVSLDVALGELQSVLNSIDRPQTRGGRQRMVKNIEPLLAGRIAGKARMSASMQRDTLLYLVNFYDDEGYAVLSADPKLSRVLAIVDKGSVSTSDFTFEAHDYSYEEEVEALKKYYCPEVDDYYVGYGFVDDPKLPNGAFNINNQVLQYTSEAFIENYNKPAPQPVVYDPLPQKWVEIEKVNPLLRTKWHQHYPFNRETPDNVAVGCVAIAAAQIMAHFEQAWDPWYWCELKTVYMYDNYRDSDNRDGSIAGQDEAGRFARYIADGCHMAYNFFWSGSSFTTPAHACSFMNTQGFSARKYNGYSEERIVNFLRTGHPVFLSAISGLFGGHAWVVDGFIYSEERTILPAKTQLLLHMNWGWGGSCDGYYVSKIFDPSKGAVSVDTSLNENINDRFEDGGKFTWHYRIITYEVLY